MSSSPSHCHKSPAPHRPPRPSPPSAREEKQRQRWALIAPKSGKVGLVRVDLTPRTGTCLWSHFTRVSHLLFLTGLSYFMLIFFISSLHPVGAGNTQGALCGVCNCLATGGTPETSPEYVERLPCWVPASIWAKAGGWAKTLKALNGLKWEQGRGRWQGPRERSPGGWQRA